MAAKSYDVIVIGAGPNGLAAAITIARAGRSVLVLEGRATVGGGARSAELTLPGYLSDICSAVHPLGIGSPFMQSVPLERYGLEWIFPPANVAHPLDDGSAVIQVRSVDETVAHLGRDGEAYRKLFAPPTRDWEHIAPTILGPLRFPRHPIAAARFGMPALTSAAWLARTAFKETRTRALFAGMAAHAMIPLNQPATAAFGLVLGTLGHAVGWPIPRGGSQMISEALAAYLRDLGGEIRTDSQVDSLDALPPARVVLADIGPRQLVRLAGSRLPTGYAKALRRYRYGPGAFKVDFALDGPIPWRAPACAQAGTVHLGGTFAEIAASEAAVARGEHPDRPFVLLAQQSLFDPTRAPAGKQVAWAYCHVPNGSTVDMTERIITQIERFAPGFRDRVLARHVMTPADFARYNPNNVGGDINGGAQDISQLFTRPVARLNPYATPIRGLYLCSASTPPGGGVHGMCGFFAAQSALREVLR